jgi:D-glycero-D-manno-heptose 1,7-bisphosphate phosphatase
VPMEKKRAIFMDRDGTLSHEVGYINDLSRMRPYAFSAEAVQLINRSDWLAIVVTNQAGVARGYFTEELVKEVHQRMESILATGGAKLDDIFYCPHHPRAGEPPYRRNCECRKPKPGMLLKAAEKHNIDLFRSVMVGDKISDVEMAKANGMAGVLVLTGYGRGELTYQSDNWQVQPDFIAENLLEAVKWILKN